MLKFFRNQNLIQNNELFGQHLFPGGVFTGNWESTFISLTKDLYTVQHSSCQIASF